MKTPVAAIQVCLETLKAHPGLTEEKRMEFIDRSLANSDRLKKLLADVSLITRMEDGSDAIAMTRVNLSDIIAGVAEEMEPIARSKGFAIDNGVTGDITITGNRGILESIFRNLIDNAISYSGGTTVTIALIEKSNGKTTITLADNGNGVGDEHLSRLFERFYRIDKGRSRAAGGTGLGLSIVKNGVLLHRGAITVKNMAKGGLLFKMTFPE
ncbi:MAG: HAMP domain-containing histidine kinase [Muribaculum sp.]|nr:HAMP domain-containing histidine kinase [Muribaculum sp.]